MADTIRTAKDRFYKPGQYAPVSGLYVVHHGTGHRPDHEVTIILAEELPACRFCKAEVEYRVLEPASHITQDVDFAGPLRLVAAKTARATKAA